LIAHVHAAHGASVQPVARISAHANVSPRQLTAAQLAPKSRHACSHSYSVKLPPSASSCPPPLQELPG